MKKITYTAIFFLILGATFKCFSQNYTPNCTQIYPIYPAPLTQAQINYANSQQQAQHPNVTKLEEPTSSYNCHNYAWVKRDGGATFWLNTPDDDSFWNDGSYTQVTTNTDEAELRVSYAGDHSAVITGPSYSCTSKWGAWGLYRHNINDVPASYLPSSTKYFYKKNTASISGPSQICSSTANYTLLNLPTGASLSWSVTGTYSISGSNTANPVLVQRTSLGYGTLTATITLSCRTYTITKNLSPIKITLTPESNGACGGTATAEGATGTLTWTVDGDLLIDGTSTTLTTTSNQISFTGTAGSVQVTGGDCSINLIEYFAPYQPEIHFAVNPAYGSEPLSASIYPYNYSYSAIRWYLDGSLAESGSEHYFNSSPPCGFSEVSVEIDLACGITVRGTATFERWCSWWRSMVIYPNPASSYLNIQPDEEKLKSLSAAEKSMMKEYEASLYDINGKLMLRGKSNGYKLNLDTRHLKSDNYFIHIKIDGEKELIKKQVIIRN